MVLKEEDGDMSFLD